MLYTIKKHKIIIIQSLDAHNNNFFFYFYVNKNAPISPHATDNVIYLVHL